MISKYIREQQRYTQNELRSIFECNTDEIVQIIRKLKEYGVLKNVKRCEEQSTLTDLAEEDIQLADVEDADRRLYYVFTFVGVIVVLGRVLKCYPKYIISNSEPKKEMKQILRVIEKYNVKEQVIHLYNEGDEGGSFNLLAVMLFLLQDYYENGIYTNDVNIVEINGNGEILWDKTINETFSYISNNRPYYMELQTKKRISDEYDYFRRLHECVLTVFSKELKETDLPELFNLATVELSEDILDDFGDEDYILYRIQNELNVQYNTRKQLTLKAIYAYIAKRVSFNSIDSFSLYGTNSFNLVWEKVCSENFGSVRDKKLSELPLGVSSAYASQCNKKLIEIIDKPIWHKNESIEVDENADTLRPDLICIYKLDEKGEYCFGIYDAKYYCIDFKHQKNGCRVTGQPGVGDVTKQYMYQLAYDDFISKQGYQYVQNMFFCPQEEAEPEYGYVEMKMLHTIGNKTLENIAVVKLRAEDMYNLYLMSKTVENITSYIPNVARKPVYNKNFANRMISYLQGISKISQVAETKMEMRVAHGKLIYPKRIKRELGAKLIYDAICPVAANVFYGFEPYEKEYGDMVAENMENSYQKCDELAQVSIEIEQNFKKVSEEELADETVIKDILKKSFENKEEISLMVRGHSLERLAEEMLELVKEIYL